MKNLFLYGAWEIFWVLRSRGVEWFSYKQTAKVMTGCIDSGIQCFESEVGKCMSLMYTLHNH